MKYYISNGNYYATFEKIDDEHITATTTSNLLRATLYKTYECAKNSLMNSDLDKGRWCIQKYWRMKKPGTKFFVVTNCTNYISPIKDEKKNVTTKYGGNRWFKNLNDATEYIRNKNPFDENYVFDEDCNLVDTSAYTERRFSQAQKVTLGLSSEDTKVHKRIYIGKNIKGLVYEKDKGICQLCGRKINQFESDWNIDHIVPLSRGGDNTMDNYQLTCKSCNAIKDSMTSKEMMKSMTNILSYQFIEKSDKSFEDQIVRSIVRGRINNAVSSLNSSLLRDKIGSIRNMCLSGGAVL